MLPVPTKFEASSNGMYNPASLDSIYLYRVPKFSP